MSTLIIYGIYILIAIFYNIFIHHLASMVYKDLPFEEKFRKTTVFLFLAGILAIIISKCFLDENKKYSNSLVSKGLSLGGFILIATVIFVNWEHMTDIFRLALSGFFFFGIIWLAYYYPYLNDDKTKYKTDF